jgi:photosystem II stability/assembly factor-like uncharacterized protein
MLICAMLALSVAQMRGQWQEAQVPPAGASSMAVQGHTLFTAYYGLVRGNIYRSEDTGRTWHESDTGLDGATVISLYADDSTLFAGTYNFGIFRSIDKGLTWQQTDSTWTLAAINAISAYGACYIAAALDNGGSTVVLRSKDRGVHWSRYKIAPLGGEQGSLAILDTTIFIGGVVGYMWYSSDSGAHWNPLPTGQLDAYTMGTKDSCLFAATVYGFPLNRSTDNGRTWTNASVGLPSSDSISGINSIVNDGTNIFIETMGGTNQGDHSDVYRSSNNGDSWMCITDGAFTRTGLHSLLVFGGYLFAGGTNLWRRPLSDFNAVKEGSYAQSETLQCFPNPSSSQTTISFSLAQPSVVGLSVVDVLGREIKLMDSKEMSEGKHSVKWNVEHVESGVYLCRFVSNSTAETRKLLIRR